MLLGRREEALRDLTASFTVDHDNMEWWYTITHDPIWNDVRETAEFRELAAAAQRFAARERAAVDELRRQGKIPRRPATRMPRGLTVIPQLFRNAACFTTYRPMSRPCSNPAVQARRK